ncbi:MAG: hypothetical protein RSE91_01920 [Bacilli bacterium]
MNKNSIKVIVTIIICYLFLSVLFLGPYFFLSKLGIEKHTHLLIGNKTFSYGYLNWSEEEDSKKIIANNKFDVYVDNNYFGKYNIRRNKSLWYYLKDNNYELLGYNALAVSSRNKYKVINYKTEEINTNDLNYLNNLLKKDKIKVTMADITMSQKITLDFDNDKKEETLYLVSSRNEESSKAFTIMFYINNSHPKIIYKDVFKGEEVNIHYVYQIDAIIDFKNDGTYELIVSKILPLNVGSSTYNLYGLSLFKNYKLLINGKEDKL